MNFPKLDDSSFLSMIKQSCKDHLNKISATRINAYFMAVLFTVCVLCCVGIEISSAIISFKKGDTYSVSGQLITLAILMLGQQSLLLHLKKQSEQTSFPTVEKLNGGEGNPISDVTQKINNVLINNDLPLNG